MQATRLEDAMDLGQTTEFLVSEHAAVPAVPDDLTLGAAGREPRGVVYTQPWVADLILDLVGYRHEADLAERYAVEPAAGEGAFLLPMVRRLVTSVTVHGRQLSDARESIRAWELDAGSADRAIARVGRELEAHGISARQARELAEGWIEVGDYLLASSGSRRADVVVGNPPYIRYDDIPEGALRAYQRLYPSMTGRCDIYVGFIEAALRQLADGGALGFICADRWMRSAYGAELRRMISAAYGVEAVIEMHEAPAFEDEVAAYPAVVVVRRAAQASAVVATAGTAAGRPRTGMSLADSVISLARGQVDSVQGFTAAIAARWFHGSAPWPSLEPRRLGLLQRLEERFAPLEDQATGTKVGIGVATGADRVFITTDPQVVEPDRIIPLAMTADTRQGELRWSGHYLIDPWRRGGGLVDLAQFPRLRDYLEGSRTALERRNTAKRNPGSWYRTIDRVNHALTTQHKLYFPDMKLTSNPVLDRGETYPHHNLYYLTSRSWDLEVLGGLLLSRVAQLFIEAYCVKMRGGTLRFQAQYLRRIRVPDPANLTGELVGRLREAFRTRDVDAATAAAALAYGIDAPGGELYC